MPHLLKINRPQMLYLYAFMIGFLIRVIPEIIAYPWPVGWDTVGYIASTIITRKDYIGTLSSYILQKRLPAFFVFLQVLIALIPCDEFLLWKIVPSILYGLLGISVLYFLKSYYNLNSTQSIIGVIFVLLAVPSLRISWDLHKNLLANIFLVAGMADFENKNFRKRIRSFIMLILAVLSHQLVAAQICLIMIFYFFAIFVLSFKKSINMSIIHLIDKVILLVIAGAFTLFYSGIYPPGGEVTVSATNLLLSLSLLDKIMNAISVVNLFIAFFFLYIPYFYKRLNLLMNIWILSSLVPAFSPLTLVVEISFWSRWMFQGVYPLTLTSWAYLSQYIDTYNSNNIIQAFMSAEKNVKRVFLITIILSTGYLVLTPDFPLPIYASPLTVKYAPSSMVQNTMPIDENPNIVDVFQWVIENVPQGSLILTAHPFYKWAIILLDGYNYTIINVKFNVSYATEIAKNNTNSPTYLIATRRGCQFHSIVVPEAEYEEIYSKGDVSVYLYKENK